MVQLIEGGELGGKTLTPLLTARKDELLEQLPPGTVLKESPSGAFFSTERKASSFGSDDERRGWFVGTLNEYVNVF